MASSDFVPGADQCDNQLCCCKPVARVWIETRSTSIFVENKMDMKRRLQVRADANASTNIPQGRENDADGSGGSQLDEGILKDQGKIYRTDAYTVHWKAESQCRPLRVSLQFGRFSADWLPEEDQVTVSQNFLLLPPDYTPGATDDLVAVLTVEDCAKNVVRCSSRAPRP